MKVQRLSAWPEVSHTAPGARTGPLELITIRNFWPLTAQKECGRIPYFFFAGQSPGFFSGAEPGRNLQQPKNTILSHTKRSDQSWRANSDPENVSILSAGSNFSKVNWILTMFHTEAATEAKNGATKPAKAVVEKTTVKSKRKGMR